VRNVAGNCLSVNATTVRLSVATCIIAWRTIRAPSPICQEDDRYTHSGGVWVPGRSGAGAGAGAGTGGGGASVAQNDVSNISNIIIISIILFAQ